MRLYETTSTVTQDQACIPQQYAHREYSMQVTRWMVLFLVLLGVVIGLAGIRENLTSSLIFMGTMLVIALFTLPVQVVVGKQTAARMYPGGENSWACTTWFGNDGIHRTDEDGDEVVASLSKMRCAYRAGNILILCSKAQVVFPVNLAQLSETDRKSLFERLKSESPKLKMIQTK